MIWIDSRGFSDPGSDVELGIPLCRWITSVCRVECYVPITNTRERGLALSCSIQPEQHEYIAKRGLEGRQFIPSRIMFLLHLRHITYID